MKLYTKGVASTWLHSVISTGTLAFILLYTHSSAHGTQPPYTLPNTFTIIKRHQNISNTSLLIETVNYLTQSYDEQFICTSSEDANSDDVYRLHTFEVVNLLKKIDDLSIIYYEDPTHLSKSEKRKYVFESQIGMARTLLYGDNNPKEALRILNDLLEHHEDNPRLYQEIGDVYLFEKNYSSAYEAYQLALALEPSLYIESKIAASLVDLGFFLEAVNLIIELRKKINHRQDLAPQLFFSTPDNGKDIINSALHQCAVAYFKMGYYPEAIALSKQLINAHPSTIEHYLLLSSAYMQAERFDEAEEVCKYLLFKFQDILPVLNQLVEIKRLENNLPDALDLLEKILLTQSNDDERLLFLKASILYEKRDFVEALQVYDQLQHTHFQAKLLIGKGKTLRAMQKEDEAIKLFQEAYTKEPDNTEAQFYYAFFCTPQKNQIAHLLETCKDAHVLSDWALLYKNQREASSAIILLEHAASINPQYIPGRYMLVEFYGITRDFEKGIPALQSMLNIFPNNYQFLLEKARVYAYGGQYLDALEEYTKVITIDKDNPVPKIDRARATFWDKDEQAAQKSYQHLLYPTVDQDLYQALGSLALKCGFINTTAVKDPIEITYQARQFIYGNYENLFNTIDDLALTEDEKIKLHEVLLQYWAKYRIQKAVYLEIYAKLLFWDRRYLQATTAYQELIAMQPGNREAIFDYALVRCHLNVCTDSLKIDNSLLHIDPVHPEATQAYERELVNGHPGIHYQYRIWKERGYGQISAIKRWESTTTATLPLSCQQIFYGSKTYMTEKSLLFNTKKFHSHLETVGYTGTFSDRFSGGLEIAQKTFLHHRFRKRHTGFAGLAWRTSDYLTLGVSYARTNEIYNYFGLKQGTQAKHLQFSADSYITRKLLLHAGTDRIRYSDNNSQRYSNITASYQFLENPFDFYLILDGEHRNTRKANYEVFGTPPQGTPPPGPVKKMYFPYWTPQHYRAGRIRLRFIRHFISPVYCGNLERFLDFNVTYKRDNDHDPGYEFDGIFHYDFSNQLRCELRGIRYSYSQWKAYGWWISLNYRF